MITLKSGLTARQDAAGWWQVLEDGSERQAAPYEVREADEAANRTPAEAALVVLETPVTITGSTVSAVKASATVELERIRNAVLTVLAG